MKKSNTKKQKDKKKVVARQLTVKERKSLVEAVDKAQLLTYMYMYVQDSVLKGIVPVLFPERMKLWKYLKDTKEVEYFIYSAALKYMYVAFYNKHSKGEQKYANLYLTWLNFISCFTCRSQQSLATLCLLSLLLEQYNLPAVHPKMQRTVITCILHGVQ